jgi:hypothetical protein
MCGGCRLSVGGKTKFACVDGPDFDGHEVDFNEAMARSTVYKPFEARAYEACRNSSGFDSGFAAQTSCSLLKAEEGAS